MEARKRAEDAEEARRLADESAARAWAERQVISNFLDEQVRILQAEHAAALELRKATQQLALQEARRARNEAQQEAERAFRVRDGLCCTAERAAWRHGSGASDRASADAVPAPRCVSSGRDLALGQRAAGTAG